MIRQEVYEGIESATGSVSATVLPELYVDDGQSDPSGLEMLPYIPDDPSSIITTFVQSEGSWQSTDTSLLEEVLDADAGRFNTSPSITLSLDRQEPYRSAVFGQDISDALTPAHKYQDQTRQHSNQTNRVVGRVQAAAQFEMAKNFTSAFPQADNFDWGYANFGIPRADRHLSLVTPQLRFLAHYKEVLWIFCPMHPAVFDESNVIDFLGSTEEEMSSLSLGISLALCMGAAVLGDRKAQAEYEGRVAQQLAFLHQYPDLMNDLSVAMSTFALSNYYLFWKLSVSESNNYRQLAMNICRSLNAVNSIVYSRCLWAMSAQMEASFDNMQSLNNELTRAKQQPYFSITSTTGTIPLTKKYNVQLPVSPQNLRKFAEGVMCSGSVIAGIRLYRENVRLNVYPGKRTVITTPLLEDLLNTMQAWEKELAALFSYLASANELPKGPLYYCNLLILAVYMQYYTVAGDFDIAEKYGAEFLRVASTYGAELARLAGGSPFILEIALGVFWKLRRFDLIGQLSKAVEPWAKVSPIVDRLRGSYANRLTEMGVLLTDPSVLGSTAPGYGSVNKNNRSSVSISNIGSPLNNNNNNHNNHINGSAMSQGSHVALNEDKSMGYGGELRGPSTRYTGPYADFSGLRGFLDRSSRVEEVTGEGEGEGEGGVVARFGALSSQSFDGRIGSTLSLGSDDLPSNNSNNTNNNNNEGEQPPKKRRNAPRRKQFFVLGQADFMNKKPRAKRTRKSSAEKEGGGEGGEGGPGDEKTDKDGQQSSRNRKRKLDSATSEARKEKVKYEEAHLALVSECYRYLAVYRKTLWHFFPMHPTVLDETNVEFFLSTEEGAQEVSPLAVSFYMGLCKGAMVCGHMKWSIEFFTRADSLLQQLLQYPEYKNDFSIASAVIVMAWQVALMEHRTEMMDTYTQVALTICQNLSAYQSDVYVKYLFLLTTFPHTLEERDKLNASLHGLKRYTYTPISTSVPAPAAPPFSSFHPGALPQPPQVGTATTRPMSQLQQRMPVSQRNMQNLVSTYTVWAQISACLTLHDDLICQETMAPVLGHIIELENLVEDINRQQQQSQDPWPGSINKLHMLYISAMRARYYFHLGDRNNAIGTAMRTLELAEKRKCRLFCASLSTVMQVLADIFFRWQEEGLLKRQLALMETWTAVPILENLRLRFLQKLLDKAHVPTSSGGLGLSSVLHHPPPAVSTSEVHTQTWSA